MSTGGSVNYTYDFPAGNTIQMSIVLTDFSGTTVLTTSVSSIGLSIYAPFVGPFGTTPPISTITPVAANTTTWQAYYTPAIGSALGVYTIAVQATTVSAFYLTDFFKFRLIDIDA